jgi:hypothetical protein
MKFDQVALYIAGCEQLGVQIVIHSPGQYSYIDGSFILTHLSSAHQSYAIVVNSPLLSNLFSDPSNLQFQVT